MDTAPGIAVADWSTQIADGIYINGQLMTDTTSWCDYCGLDMTEPIEISIQGRVLKTHKRCQDDTIKHYG